MQQLITKDILTVYWDSILGEVSGQTFYILSNDMDFIPDDFPLYFWEKDIIAKSYKLFGDNWVVWVWDIKVSNFPDNWISIMKETLLFFNNTAMLSWCSLEGYFEDPPSLFDTVMASGYYAFAYGKEFTCHTDINNIYVSLSEEDLAKLKQILNQILRK